MEAYARASVSGKSDLLEGCLNDLVAGLWGGFRAGLGWEIRGGDTKIGRFLGIDKLDLEYTVAQAEMLVYKTPLEKGTCNAPPQINVTGSDINANIIAGDAETFETTYTVKNVGDESMDWSASTQSRRMDLSPRSGTVPANGSQQVTATISDSQSLLTETHSFNVVFNNESWADAGESVIRRSNLITVTDPEELISGRYRAIADGSLIEDVTTDLVWTRCTLGQQWDGEQCTGNAKKLSWDRAIGRGSNGFRLPTRPELKSIVHCRQGTPSFYDLDLGEECTEDDHTITSIDPSAFPKTEARRYWASNTDQDLPEVVNFSDGTSTSGEPTHSVSSFPVGTTGASSTVPVVMQSGDLVINGVSIPEAESSSDLASMDAHSAASAIAKAVAINKKTGESGVKAVVNETTIAGSGISSVQTERETIAINGFEVWLPEDRPGDYKDFLFSTTSEINSRSGLTGITASFDGDPSTGIALTAEDGRNITLHGETPDTAERWGLPSTSAPNGNLSETRTFTGTYSLVSEARSRITLSSDGNISRAGFRAGNYNGNYLRLVREPD